MGSIFEEIVKNKEQLILKILDIIEGREARTKVNLDNVELNVGNVEIRVNGSLEFVVAPVKKKKEE